MQSKINRAIAIRRASLAFVVAGAMAAAPLAANTAATVSGKPVPSKATLEPNSTTLDQRLIQQRAAERVKLANEATIRSANNSDGRRKPDDEGKTCAPVNSDLLTVYGPVGNLNAEILLCGAAVLRRKVGQDVGDGWVVHDIQTSHVVIAQGKKLAQIWMPAPRMIETRAGNSAAGAQGVPGLPMLPPLPVNLAPTPGRAASESSTGR